jgi:ATP-dependent helicase HrpB
MPASPELPIDSLLPELAGVLASSSSLVIEAPPGAGKTTGAARAAGPALRPG